MNPWALLIARYGIPGAMQIWEILANKNQPTKEDWDKLLFINDKTKEQYIEEAQKRLET